MAVIAAKVSRTSSAVPPKLPYIDTYTYDNAGNRTSVQLNGGTPAITTYNAANQITNAGFSYDNAGNLTNDGTAAYTYDALNRTTVRGGTTYAYNGDGTLVSQLTGGVTTRYTQDLVAPLTQVLQTKIGSAAITDYLYGLNRLASLNSGVKTWYAADALGSVRRTVTDAGTPLGVINYDPWGTPESGTVPTFGFTGEVQDVSSGLVNLRARWYSTGRGRFTSVDPFAGYPEQPQTLAPYSYAENDPINFTDPSGAFRCKNTVSGRTSSNGPPSRGDRYTYRDFCTDSYAVADAWVNSAGMTHSLGVLVSLFSANGFPGGTTAKAIKFRQHDLTAAAERLEFVLDYTSSTIEPAQFAKDFRDSGFGSEFADPWPDSRNQVGHFLTAVGFGYNSTYYVRDPRTVVGLTGTAPDIGTLSDDEVAIRLIVGHEKWPDRAASNGAGNRLPLLGGLLAARAQYEAANADDVSLFIQAVDADRLGDVNLRNCLIQIMLPGVLDNNIPSNRNGNSLQDLRLSVKGWRFGQMIKNKEITQLNDASLWLLHNLR